MQAIVKEWERANRNSKSPTERVRYAKMARIRRTEERQRRGSQYARAHRGEPGKNGGPKGF